MSIKLLIPLIGLCLSFSASSAGLGYNPFQKPSSPTSAGGPSQKTPPPAAPAQNTQTSKPAAPIPAPVSKPEKQSK